MRSQNKTMQVQPAHKRRRDAADTAAAQPNEKI
jgi:hypothetical protein